MDRRLSSSPEVDGSYNYKRSRREREYRSRRSRSRNRTRELRGRRSRSRSRSRVRRSPDLYHDIINQDIYDVQRDRNYFRPRDSRDMRDLRDTRDMRDREQTQRRPDDRGKRDREIYNKREYSPNSYLEDISNDSHDSENGDNNYSNYPQVPNNKIIVRGLAQHITETDINNALLLDGLSPLSIRVIRKRKTGASRGFAFVEFSTEEEATRWMDYKQGILMIDQYRAIIQYSIPKDLPGSKDNKFQTDWYCAKCGVFNFKRRENCFKCYASREESEKGGEGSDEVSNILTKKIMLRNLDVLTNEEGVLTTMQDVVPTLVSKISKVLICRDPLTQTSRGICYLSFENLIDSMNTHNALKALDPPLQIDTRDVLISYCVDSENRTIVKNQQPNKLQGNTAPNDSSFGQFSSNPGYQYTIADVPRLAEYSTSIYASNAVEHEHYLKYYTQFYVAQISKGQFNNLPSISQMGGDTANSGAAVAQSAMQRKMQKFASNHHQPSPNITSAVQQIQTPKGNDNIKYPTPDISQYQYDETSGYYYDPKTGLYYDAHSQYYYNNETGSYLYWDNDNSTYVQAPAASAIQGTFDKGITVPANQPAIFAETSQVDVNSDNSQNATDSKKDDEKKEKKHEPKQDKVKVAKKMMKDMEKWAKQLNQKKDMMQMPMQMTKVEDTYSKPSKSDNNGYADVGFSILEKKDKGGPSNKFSMDISSTATNISKEPPSKLVPSYCSDSENEAEESRIAMSHINSEKDYVDFEKLTCLLCKRAFQSQDILAKHLKLSNLHKENLRKYNQSRGGSDMSEAAAQSYRDRAKERRQKYGEDDSPPPNRSKERFQRELEKQKANTTAPSTSTTIPIGENNVGNRLLQKMGWSEGQGLGRSNQGRTNIIEAESRSATAGLGSKSTSFAPGDDYKSYIKKMMKSRYESVN